MTENGSHAKIGTSTVKQGLAQMLKGGVIVSFLLVRITSYIAWIGHVL
jgi:pyridoxal biosynthesis lyase PdxS